MNKEKTRMNLYRAVNTMKRARLLLECLKTQVQIMHSANHARAMKNESPAYGEKHFEDLLKRCEDIEVDLSTTFHSIDE